MSRGGCCRAARVTAAALLALSMLAGCAEIMLATVTLGVAGAMSSPGPHWVETNRLTVDHPAPDVYAILEKEVEKNDRKIVERNPAAGTLLVSYPFSLLKNNWGGTIKITCVADQYGTTVTVLGDGRDEVSHVRAIGNEIMGDVAEALRREPRAL